MQLIISDDPSTISWLNRCWRVKWPKKNEQENFKDANEVQHPYLQYYFVQRFVCKDSLKLLIITYFVEYNLAALNYAVKI